MTDTVRGPGDPAPDWGTVYVENVSALAELAIDLADDERLRRHVPATPAWTVHDVYAHLVGGPADALAGRMDGAPGPEWTARHVREHVGLPVTELAAMMTAQADQVAASVAGNPRPALVWDVAVHHADLREALGLGRLPERLWRPVHDALRGRLLGEADLAVSDYEVFRALFSRRSKAQLRAWSGLPAGLASELGVFGPRDDDQPVPA